MASDGVHSSAVKSDDCNPVSAEAEYPVTHNTHGKGWRETTVCNEVRESERATLPSDSVPESTFHNNADVGNSEDTKTRLPLFATDDDIDDIINDL